MAARAVTFVALFALVTSVVACGGSSHTASPSSSTTPPTTWAVSASDRTALQHAITRATTFAAPLLAAGDPHIVITYDFLYRAFGIQAFAGARRFALAKQQRNARTDPEFRLFDASSRLDPKLLDFGAPPTRLIPYALACDTPGLPAKSESFFRSQAADGDYALTHVGLALAIMEQMHCRVPWAPAVERLTIDDLVAASRARPTVDDLAIEQLAVLAYLGVRSAVPREKVMTALSEQQPDGGWAGPDTYMRLHTTALSIWLFELLLGPPRAPYVAPS